MKCFNLLILLYSMLLSATLSAQSTIIYQVGISKSNSFGPITNTSDGGHLLHYTTSGDGGNDDNTIIIKTDSEFNPIWRKYFTYNVNNKRVLNFADGTSILFTRYGCHTIQLPNGQTSWTCSQFKLHKFNSQGETVWAKVISGALDNSNILPYDAFIKDDNTIKISGNIGANSKKPVIINFDTDGNFIDGTIIQGISGTADVLSKEMNTGNYYALISTSICKFDQNDNVIWCKSISSPNASVFTDATNSAITTLSNGDLLIATYTSIYPTQYQLLARISANGNLIWSKRIGSYSSQINFGGATELLSGDIVISIVEAKLQKVFKISGDGNLIWSKAYRNASSTSALFEKNPNEWYFAVKGYNNVETSFNNPSVFRTDSAGESTCNGVDTNLELYNTDIFLQSVDNSLNQIPLFTLLSPLDTPNLLIALYTQNSTTNCSQLNADHFNEQIVALHPNPNNGNFTIKSTSTINNVEIFTTLGQKVLEINPEQLEVSLSIGISGVYLVRIKTASGYKVFKTVITK